MEHRTESRKLLKGEKMFFLRLIRRFDVSIFRPIFIVNTIHDSETDNDGKLTNEIDSRSITQNFDTEINNNNFPYLKCEDKGDKNDKPMQCENKVSQIVTVAAFSREKIVEKSLRGITAIRMEANKADENEALSLDSDESTQSLNEAVTQCRDDNSIDAVNESAEKKINIEKVIKTDSERLGAKCADEADAAFVTSEVPIVAERRNEVTQSTNGESEFIFVRLSPECWSLYCSERKFALQLARCYCKYYSRDTGTLRSLPVAK